MGNNKIQELFKRVVVAAILLPLSLLIIIKAHPYLFLAFVVFISVLATYEFIKIMKNSDIYLYIQLVWASSVITPTFIYFLGFQVFVAYSFIILFILFMLKMFSANPTEKVMEEVSYNFIAILFIPFLTTFLALLRNIGYEWVLFLSFVIWASDTFAYFTGVTFGKHKLISKISPGKSVEGLIGGVLGAVIVGILFNYFLLKESWIIMTVILIDIIAAGVLGDLIESMIKRSANVKDSGKIFPGHGGILDRLDSIILASPVLYFYLIYILGK